MNKKFNLTSNQRNEKIKQDKIFIRLAKTFKELKY